MPALTENQENTDIVLVTGAASGIGRAVAHRIARTEPRPAVLVLADTDAAGLHETAAMLAPAAAGPAHNPLQIETTILDVSDPAAVARAFDDISHRYGPVTRLAHCAGVLVTGPAVDATVADWDRVMAVNARGTFLVTTHAARQMCTSVAGNRAIVVVASNAVGVPRAGMGLYAASKAASLAVLRSLGLELAGAGIRCNSVCPGSTDTAMQRDFWGAAPEAGRQAVLTGDPGSFRVGIPLGRLAEPDDVAQAVTFLLSDAARQITLHDLYVDGGASLRA